MSLPKITINLGFICVTASLVLWGITAWADELNIKVVGLFNGYAIVDIKGQQRLLKAGKPSPEGITLISANSHKAVLEINGVQTDYFLASNQVDSNFSPPKQETVILWPKRGMYYTSGIINDVGIDFLIDTGASTIALNSVMAKRIGLNYLKGKPIMIATASGIKTGYSIMLDKVQVGKITLYNVEAAVSEGNYPDIALLGMTFLGRLDMIRTGDRLILKNKF